MTLIRGGLRPRAFGGDPYGAACPLYELAGPGGNPGGGFRPGLAAAHQWDSIV